MGDDSALDRLATLVATAKTLEPAVRYAGVKTIARVIESSRALDLAIAFTPTVLGVLRCVEHVSKEDHAALETMVDQGDFTWAALVYTEEAPPGGARFVEAFHVAELRRLVARLHELVSIAT